MACWYLEHLSTKERVILHNGKNTIGRHSTCKIVVTYAYISRKHVEITVSPNEVLVRCLKAPNGVYVNAEEIAQDGAVGVPVREGDTICLGCPIPEKVSRTYAVFRLKKGADDLDQIVILSDSDDSAPLPPLKPAAEIKAESVASDNAAPNSASKETDKGSPTASSSHPILHLPKLPHVKPELVQTARDITNIFGEADEAIIDSVLEINPYLYNHLSKDKQAVPISKLHDGQVIELAEKEDSPDGLPCPKQPDHADSSSMPPPFSPAPSLEKIVEEYDEDMAMSQAVLQEMKEEMALSDGEENFFDTNNNGSRSHGSPLSSINDDDIIVITDSDDDDLCSKVTDWSNKLLSQKANDVLSQAYPMADSDAEDDFQSQMKFRNLPKALRMVDSSDEESDLLAPLFPKCSKPLRIDSSSDESDTSTPTTRKADSLSSKPSPMRMGANRSNSTADDCQLFTRRQRKDPDDIFQEPDFSPSTSPQKNDYDCKLDDWDFDSVIFGALNDESPNEDLTKKSNIIQGRDEIDLDVSMEVGLMANSNVSMEKADTSGEELKETPSVKKAAAEPAVANKDTKMSRISQRRSTIAASREDLAQTDETKDKSEPEASNKNYTKEKESSVELEVPSKPYEVEKAAVEPAASSKDTKKSRISHRRKPVSGSREVLAGTSIEKTKDKVESVVSNENHAKTKGSSMEKEVPFKRKEVPKVEPAVSHKKSRISQRRSTIAVSREEFLAASGEDPKETPVEKTEDQVESAVSNKNYAKTKEKADTSGEELKETPSVKKAAAEPAVANKDTKMSRISQRRSTIAASREDLAQTDETKDKSEPEASNKNYTKEKESSVELEVPSKPYEVEKAAVEPAASSKDTKKSRISHRRKPVSGSREDLAGTSIEKTKDKVESVVSNENHAKTKGSSMEKEVPSKRKEVPKVEPAVSHKKSRISQRRSTIAVSREEFLAASGEDPKETPVEKTEVQVESAVSNKNDAKAKGSSVEKRKEASKVEHEEFLAASGEEPKETPSVDQGKVEPEVSNRSKENEPPPMPHQEFPPKREPNARLRSRATSCYYERPQDEPDLVATIVNGMDVRLIRGPEVVEAPSLPKCRGKLRGVSAVPKDKVLDRQRFLDYQVDMNAKWKEKPKPKKTVDDETKDKRREALKKLSEKKPVESTSEQSVNGKRKATTTVPKVSNYNRGAFLTVGIDGPPPSKIPSMDLPKPNRSRRATIDVESFSQQIQATDFLPRRIGRPPERKEAEYARNQRTCNRVTFASMEKDMEDKLRLQKISKRVRFSDKVQIKFIEGRRTAQGCRGTHGVHGKKDTELLFSSTYAERRERWARTQVNDLTSHFETILKWANQWLKLRSVDAVANADVLKPIALEFETVKQYKEIFVPLMKLELLTTIEREYKVGRESYEVCLQFPVEEKNSFYCLTTRVFTKPTGKYMLYTLSSGDKLKETFANLREQGTKNGHELVFEILKDGISLETFEGIKLLTARPVVDSLRVELGVLQAVDQLSRSPLHRKIIKPAEMLKNAHIPSYGTPFVFKGFAKLNPHQEDVCSSTYQRVIDDVKPSITLIQGPPGTGKSMVIANISFQCLYGKAVIKRDRKILICAHSNTAVDSIVYRLHNVRENFNEKDRFHMLRYGLYEKMNTLSRQYSLENKYQSARAHKRDRLTPENRAILKERHLALQVELNLMKIRNLDGTWLFDRYQEMTKQLLDWEEQLNPRLTHREEYDIAHSLIKEANIVCTTLSSCVKLGSFINYFDICLIDEATQCTEPWTLLPMRFGIPHLVLVGDTQQLPAVVLSQKAVDFGLSKSMFDRIQRSLEKQQGVQPNGHLSVHTKLFSLTTQYRMHPEICKWPNRYFYEDRLVNGQGLDMFLDSPLIPYSVINLGFTSDTSDPKTRSIRNEEEARFVAKLLAEMENHLPSKVYLYGLISPYSSQCHTLSQVIPSHMKIMPPHTVDAYQGMESDVVVISNARTRGTGFLSNYQRLNVAVTRPRRCLIICGNFNDLQSVPMWKNLLGDARKRGVYFDLKREDVANLKESLMSKLLVKTQEKANKDNL
ncbi:titin homolog isoform X1 [Drosophila miranda]|uniref:titin homolog isoform X1 n=1 Tax=Drosophila miranda TaxID=7229 RepID=UPI00143F23CB|nr:titin homolog isoform X1 [Drosophila miranda]